MTSKACRCALFAYDNSSEYNEYCKFSKNKKNAEIKINKKINKSFVAILIVTLNLSIKSCGNLL